MYYRFFSCIIKYFVALSGPINEASPYNLGWQLPEEASAHTKSFICRSQNAGFWRLQNCSNPSSLVPLLSLGRQWRRRRRGTRRQRRIKMRPRTSSTDLSPLNTFRYDALQEPPLFPPLLLESLIVSRTRLSCISNIMTRQIRVGTSIPLSRAQVSC